MNCKNCGGPMKDYGKCPYCGNYTEKPTVEPKPEIKEVEKVVEKVVVKEVEKHYFHDKPDNSALIEFEKKKNLQIQKINKNIAKTKKKMISNILCFIVSFILYITFQITLSETPKTITPAYTQFSGPYISNQGTTNADYIKYSSFTAIFGILSLVAFFSVLASIRKYLKLSKELTSIQNSKL